MLYTLTTSRLFACRLPCSWARNVASCAEKGEKATEPAYESIDKKGKGLGNKVLKCAKDQTAANCTWSTSDRGGLRTMNVEVCCSTLMCCDTIAPVQEGVRLADVIILLRRYYSFLDKAGKRAFIADRTSVKSEKVDESIELLVRTNFFSHPHSHTQSLTDAG